MDNNASQSTTTILVQSRNAYNQQQQPALQQQVPGTPTSSSAASVNKIIYSAPASPASPSAGISNDSAAASSPVSGANSSSMNSSASSRAHSASLVLSTPKKNHLDAGMLRKIREQLMSPGGCDLQALRLEVEPAVNVIKERYLISSMPCQISPTAAAAAAAKAPISYRHLIDLTSSNLKCTDVFTEEHFLCKIINEPLHKVQLAYFQLQQDSESCRSEIYGHNLMRGVRDIVPLSKNRTYVIIPAGAGAVQGTDTTEAACIYEDLHTYIRNKRRLTEQEARPLFHQICQTVQVCHRNGIVLRDLKLKRFYFIDEARTKLQYESLEGSMILDNPVDDTLTDKIGCPLYTAPELLYPNATYNGKPADMWSLGVILYTMLVGQYPFYEKGNCNLITIIRHGQVQIPSTLSRSVRWLLLALLRKNHDERLGAEYIFLSPWLRQTQPYYMYIPVNVIIPDSDDEEDVDGLKPLDYSMTHYNDEHDNSSDVEMG